MESPAKVVFVGDRDEGNRLVGLGHKSMMVLENLMHYQRLQQYAIQVIPFPGALIRCSKIFGLRQIEIIVGRDEVGRKIERARECPCWPNFTFAIIIAAYPENPDAAFLKYGRFYYDVLACAGGITFVPLENVLSAGWERYTVGQYLLVTIGDDTDVDNGEMVFVESCDRKCLLEEQQPRYYATSPFHAIGKMRKFIEEEVEYERGKNGGWMPIAKRMAVER